VDAAAANLAAALSGAFGQAVVVFDNTSSGIFGTTFCAVGCELGNQITLAGPERIVTEFLFGYRGFFAVPGSELAQTARVRFYANDGVITGGSPSPGTLLFDSQPFPIASGPGFQEITLTGLLVPVPETFTWAVEFSGDPPNAILQIAGLLAVLDPATIGAVDLQWVRSANPEPGCFAGCWAPRRADSPPTSPGSPFKARVTAIVEPADRGNRGD
jgi:hypothetical protein